MANVTVTEMVDGVVVSTITYSTKIEEEIQELEVEAPKEEVVISDTDNASEQREGNKTRKSFKKSFKK